MFLRYVIRFKRILLDDRKVEVVLSWPFPFNVNEVRSFYGFDEPCIEGSSKVSVLLLPL